MYTIENRQAITNSMTPAAAASYYGRPRTVDEFIYHWWNTVANRAKSPENILQYMIANNKSVNYIVGWDDYQNKVRIIHMTPTNRVALTTQSANIFSESVEVDPLITTSDPRAYELYKAVGWLHLQRENAHGKRLRGGIHFQYWQTQCSPIDKARVLREADKWRFGAYNPTKPPVVEGAVIKYARLYPDTAPKIYRFKRNANLYNFNHKRHADMNIILPFKQGDTIAIVGEAHNQTVNSRYLMTKHSFGNADKTGQPAFTNGVNVADLELVVTTNPPAVEPPKPPEPAPTPTPPAPVAIKYKPTADKYFRPKNDRITLWDFNHEKHSQMTPAGYVDKSAPDPIRIVGVAIHPTGSEYYMTAFSYNNSGKATTPFRTTGFNKADLEEVTPPTAPVPVNPPIDPVVPEPLPPSDDSLIDRQLVVVGFLEMLRKLIDDFLTLIRVKK